MFGKKKKLPLNIQKILNKGDINELKAIFEHCDINATQGKYGSNIFGLKPLNRELLEWAIEQGGDINKPDYYGVAPIFKQVSVDNDNLEIMVELGADIFATAQNGRTLMRTVLDNGTSKQINFLMEKGLTIDATNEYMSALEYCLYNKPEDYNNLLDRVEFLLKNGAKVTDKSRTLLQNLISDCDETVENNVLDKLSKCLDD